MFKFIVGWIGIGFGTWLFILFFAVVTILLSHRSKEIKTQIVCTKAKLLVSELMRPENVLYSVFEGPILTMKLIKITLEAFFN